MNEVTQENFIIRSLDLILEVMYYSCTNGGMAYFYFLSALGMSYLVLGNGDNFRDDESIRWLQY